MQSYMEDNWEHPLQTLEIDTTEASYHLDSFGIDSMGVDHHSLDVSFGSRNVEITVNRKLRFSK